jgi:hypothetical protein
VKLSARLNETKNVVRKQSEPFPARGAKGLVLGSAILHTPRGIRLKTRIFTIAPMNLDGRGIPNTGMLQAQRQQEANADGLYYLK